MHSSNNTQEDEGLCQDIGVEVVGIPRKKPKTNPQKGPPKPSYMVIPHTQTQDRDIEIFLQDVAQAPSTTPKAPRVRHPAGTVLAPPATTTKLVQLTLKKREDPTAPVVHVAGDPVPPTFRVVGISSSSKQQARRAGPSNRYFTARLAGPSPTNLAELPIKQTPIPSVLNSSLDQANSSTLTDEQAEEPTEYLQLDLRREIFQEEEDPPVNIDMSLNNASVDTSNSHQSKTTTKNYLLLTQQLLQERKERDLIEQVRLQQTSAPSSLPSTNLPWQRPPRNWCKWGLNLIVGVALLVVVVGVSALIIAMTTGASGIHENVAHQNAGTAVETATLPPMPPIDKEIMQPVQPTGTSPQTQTSSKPEGHTPLLPRDFPKATEVILSNNDLSSPQVQAYQWLLQDPSIADYPSWRQFQRMALATLYYSTNGPEWHHASNWLRYDGTECQWYPHACDSMGHIRRILLPDSNLDGSLPKEIFWLTSLQQIQLNDNPRLRGTIPQQIGQLTDLQVLWLHRCGFTATSSPALPTEVGLLGESLLYLDVSGNPLGRRNHSTTSLSRDPTYNNDLPTQLAQLTRLKELICSSAYLSGTVPSEVGLMTNLEAFEAHENHFIGTLPSQLGALRSVTSLDLSLNHLEGTLPIEYSAMENLQSLWLYENLLSGEAFPSSWGRFSLSLESLDLSMNKFNSLSSEIGKLAALRGLWLYSNEIRGTLPRSIGNLSNLLQISLFSNLFSGTIPNEIASLSSLRGLWVDNNQLTGRIPVGLFMSTKLMSLHLFDNRLEGSFPQVPTRPAYAFEEIYLQNNLLTSNIPPSIGNLLSLEVLHLHGNELTSSIPSELARLTQLVELTLQENELTGAVPWELCAVKISAEEFFNVAVDCGEVSCQCGCTCRV